ncbi:MAG: hypothetical protein LBQ24_00430 [Candidatus Peribacteria bacterium]|jgi:glutaredoxin|nr:hypothetical protein [Candidatus Peribacteria bacterium]
MKKLACIMFITILSLNISYASDEAEGLTDTENVIYFDDVELDVDSDVVIEDISKNLENVEITTDNSENSTIDVEKLLGDLILTSNYTYYYGDLCPHCLNVDEYLTENDLYNKLNITKKEVWNDIKNAEEMKITLERLGLDVEKSGVPFIV